MSSLTFAIVFQASMVATGADTYADAHRATTKSGKPMVVMVGTDWCGPCQSMKKNIIPEVRRRGLLKKVIFAFVNPDRQRALGRKLIGSGPVPQLIMFRRTRDGWRRRKLVGSQSVDSVEKFINQGVALDEASKSAPAEQRTKEKKEAGGKGAEKTKAQPVGTK